MSRYIGAVMAALMMLVSVGSESVQARCAILPPAARIEGAAAIVSGTVTGVDKRLEQTYYTIAPDRFFKGEAVNPVIVRTESGHIQSRSEEMELHQGEAYTLYLTINQRYFTMNACTGTHAGTPDAEEAPLLGAGALPPAPSTERPSQPRMWVPYTAMGIAAAAIGLVLLSLKRRKPD